MPMHPAWWATVAKTERRKRTAAQTFASLTLQALFDKIIYRNIYLLHRPLKSPLCTFSYLCLLVCQLSEAEMAESAV